VKKLATPFAGGGDDAHGLAKPLARRPAFSRNRITLFSIGGLSRQASKQKLRDGSRSEDSMKHPLKMTVSDVMSAIKYLGRDIMLLSLVSGGILLTASSEAATSPISDAAYALLAERAQTNRQAFYVYRDADSAFNHSFPSGLFGTTSKIHIDAACIDDTNSPTGCSTDLNIFDRERGNVFRVTFDRLTGNQFAGVNFEEPERWGATRIGVGYNLTGVTQAVVRLRCPTPGGMAVQFGVAGYTSSFIRIPQSDDYSLIRLNFNIPASVLANVHILFSIAVSVDAAPSSGTLLIDWVQFLPVPARQTNSLGFPLANETFGVVARSSPGTAREPWPLDQLLRNLSTTYESALTALALLDRGTPNDMSAAKIILDSFTYALTNDNHGDPLPSANEWFGLHNGFLAGDLALFNGQGPGAGQKDDVRLAGFSCGPASPTGFCVVLDGATGGNVSFAILALCSGYKEFNDVRYLDAARKLANWIVYFLKDNSAASYGGYFLGYPDQGEPKVLIRSKSVENNADIFAGLTALAELERQIANTNAFTEWTTNAQVAGDFVMQMHNTADGRFYAGTVPTGTPSGPGLTPNGPQRGDEVINTFDFLDAVSFIALALAESPRYRHQIDWRRSVQFMATNFAQVITVAGREFRGFNLVKTPVAGPNGIAWEFTGQAILTMKFIDRLYGENRFGSEAASYLNEIRHAQTNAPFADERGLVASTLQDGDTLPPIEQCLSTPFQCVPERVGLAATTWAIFAERRFNPLGNDVALRITSTRFLGANLHVTFTTYAGQSYRIEGTDDPASGAWETDTSDIAGTGADVEVNLGAVQAAQRFYRVWRNP